MRNIGVLISLGVNSSPDISYAMQPIMTMQALIHSGHAQDPMVRVSAAGEVGSIRGEELRRCLALAVTEQGA